MDARNIPEPADRRKGDHANQSFVVATIPKNKADDVLISLAHYNGCDLIDIRVHSLFKGVVEKRPTKKGVSLKLALLPELIAALNVAAAEARRVGLLTDESVAAKDPTAAERQRRRRERLRVSRSDVTGDSVTVTDDVTPLLFPNQSEQLRASDTAEQSAPSEPRGHDERRA